MIRPRRTDTGRPLEVVAYSGARGEEEPRTLFLDGVPLEVRAILERWAEPEGRFFRVAVGGERMHLLFCRDPDLTWWLIEESRP